jgi:hypothetical protein
LLSCRPARRYKRDSRRDQQRVPGALKGRTESFYGAPVDLAVFHKFREVVVKACVNNSIRGGCSLPQTFQIGEIAAVNLGTSGGK